MNQSFYYNRNEHIVNANRVTAFYKDVLKEYTVKLQKQFRFKGVISGEQIEQLQITVQQRLGQPIYLFKKSLEMKEGTRTEYQIKNQTNPQKQCPELKQEFNDDNFEYLMGNDLKIKDKDEEMEDDLAQFLQAVNDNNEEYSFKPMKSQIQVKKEDLQDVDYQRKPQIQQDIKQEQQSQHQEQEYTVQFCLQHLNSILLSTFSSPSLKHKPKQQKIIVSLDNTFLKSEYNQFFIGQVSVDINKIQKTEISVENKLSRKHK